MQNTNTITTPEKEVQDLNLAMGQFLLDTFKQEFFEHVDRYFSDSSFVFALLRQATIGIQESFAHNNTEVFLRYRGRRLQIVFTPLGQAPNTPSRRVWAEAVDETTGKTWTLNEFNREPMMVSDLPLERKGFEILGETHTSNRYTLQSIVHAAVSKEALLWLLQA